MPPLTPQGKQKPLRHRFRFSVRSLLLGIAIIAGLLTWLGKPIFRSRLQRPIVRQIEAVGGTVYYHYQLKPGAIDWSKPPPGPAFIRSLLGDDTFANVGAVSLGSSPTDEDVGQLPQLPALLEVALDGDNITDRCVSDLLQIRKLWGLALADTAISPDGMRKLADCQTLQSLSLMGVEITDAHARQLHRFPKLRYLQLTKTSVTDDGLMSLSPLIELRQLDVFVAPSITDAGVAWLGELKKLEQLKLFETGITDEALSTIARIPSLQILQLRDKAITDAGFMKLETLHNLRCLELRYTSIGDQGLSVVTHMPHLQYLFIDSTNISDQALHHLQSLHNLEHLHLSHTAITDEAIEPLAQLKSLRSLVLTVGNGVSNEGAVSLQQALPDCTFRCEAPNGSSITIDTK